MSRRGGVNDDVAEGLAVALLLAMAAVVVSFIIHWW